MDNVYAFLVGIDKYEQPGWNVTGPCSNAIAIASWLLDAGANPEQVHLFLQPQDDNHEEMIKDLQARNVQVRLSTKANDLDTFRRSELKANQPNAKLLFYWSGHGCTDEDGDRIFFCNDYKSDSLTNRVFNGTNVLRQFRTTQYQHFQEQICLADVCGSKLGLPTESNKAPAGTWADNTKQYAFFASPEGEYAYVDSNQRGAFTNLALQVLEGFSQWPELNEFSERMQQVFQGYQGTLFRIETKQPDAESSNQLVGKQQPPEKQEREKQPFNGSYLSQDELHKVFQAAIKSGLTGTRTALLAGMHPAFVASLAHSSAPSAQLLMDLNTLNRTEKLMDESVPMREWLKQARLLTAMYPESEVFEEALKIVESQVD